jgi:SAM-dependent methyltransferase
MPAMDYERVAAIYDAYTQKDFDFAFFMDEVKRRPGRALELMAGTGRLSLPLIEAGADLTCVDSSPAMLEVLKKKLEERGLGARLVCMDAAGLSLDEAFDLVFIPFHSFAEILDEGEQKEALGRIAEHLTDSGRFICTLHNPLVRLRTAGAGTRLLGRFPLGEGGDTLLLWSLENYFENERLVRGYQLYEIFDKDLRMKSRFFVDLAFYVHDRESFEALAAGAGFTVESLYGAYDRTEFDREQSPVMIWSLRMTSHGKS